MAIRDRLVMMDTTGKIQLQCYRHATTGVVEFCFCRIANVRSNTNGMMGMMPMMCRCFRSFKK